MNEESFNHLQKGLFLIASPEIDHPFYRRSVLLLCDHTPAGSFGLAVNKPFEVDTLDPLLIESELPSLENITTRSGGLMQPMQMMLLHTSKDIPDQTLQVSEDIYLGGDLEFLEKTIAEQSQQLLLCFGYSGWNPGQLEREFMEGSWYTYPATKEYLFQVPLENLWRTLLQDMGGKFKSLSMIPEDLSQN
ncbi:MAG: YqgE/AlgH family protein [Simkaniaceae bacterium]|nr:YqgE/AlgH family protein [Simkaniaceae bacterium]MCF7851752.1 YqgE/AlgH family protein [Simkaniaceae bacterium]